MPNPGIPESPISKVLHAIYNEVLPREEGEVATYIPELAKADPKAFGLCIVTAAGNVYEVGDTAVPFTIQSISKPFVYGLALEDRGFAEVHAKVGVEPTGDAFNSISLEPGTGRPRNPMINAGAIATTGLVAGANPTHRRDRVLGMLSKFAGRPLSIDAAIHRSESETGHRNRAIGHMLRNFDILTGDPEPTVDLYFQQCSVEVTCRDLGVMAATLANHGVNPLTGEHALQGAYIEHVLSVMGTCGMYNWAGEWLYRVGIPAKSGVAGGVLAVLPGQFGIGVYSPRLDPRGNSVRGIEVCNALSRYFDLHLFNMRNPGPALRSRYNAALVPSRRVRPPLERRLLADHGASIQVFQLQGVLGFGTVEPVVHDAIAALAETSHLVIDLQRAQALNESAGRLFHDLIRTYADSGATIVFCHAKRHRTLARVVEAKLGAAKSELFHTADQLDTAVEWCEDRVIAAHATEVTTPAFVMPEGNELLSGLDPARAALLAARLKKHEFAAGERIVAIGAPAKHLYLIERGRVSVVLEGPDGARQRLATFCPGMVFGELALLEETTRTASVFADTETVCGELEVGEFKELATKHPEIQVQVLRNIALSLSDKLRKANRALAAVQG